MALSYVTYTTAGSVVDYTFDKGYIQTSDVSVYLDGVLKTVTTDYTWFNATTVRLNSYPGDGVVVRIERSTTNTERLVDFQDAGNLTEADLDLNSDQMFYLAQEAQDDFNDSAMGLDTDNKWDASSKVIKNVADPSSAQDAATLAYGDANWGGTAAADALAAQVAAEAAQTAAEAAQTAAEAAQTGAESAETDALAAQAAAELALDEFTDLYLGAKAVSPTLDNDGDPLQSGAMYYDTVDKLLYVYDTGTSLWVNSGLTIAYADAHYQPLDTELSAIAAITPTKGRILVADGSTWQPLTVGTDGYGLVADSGESTGVVWRPRVVGTEYSTTSGSTVEETDIPDWVTEIKIQLNAVSGSGAERLIVQVGYGATPTYETSGYHGHLKFESVTVAAFSSSFLITPAAAANVYYGTIHLHRLSPTSNVWTVEGTGVSYGGVNALGQAYGNITVSAALTAVKVAWAAGGNFDAGSVSVTYR